MTDGHFRLSVRIIGRSAGQFIVPAAAYRAGERLFDEQQGKTFDYSYKQNVEWREIITPDTVPAWVTDRERLWNEVDKAEKRKDAQLAREVILSLPRQLDSVTQKELVQRFVKTEFVDKGMIADVCFHNPDAQDGGKNPHAHVLITMRSVDASGFGQKCREWNTAVFTRDDMIIDKSQLVGLRAEWANYINQAFAERDSAVRVDHRSYANRDLDKLPQHIPSVAVHMHQRGKASDIYRECRRSHHEHQAQAQKTAFLEPNTFKRATSIAHDVAEENLRKRLVPKIEPPHNPLEPNRPSSYALRLLHPPPDNELSR